MKRLISRAWYRNHVANLAIVGGAVVILGGTVSNALDLKSTSDHLKLAICTLRHDRQRAVKDGERWLNEHPHGIPGITATDVERNIKLQLETIRAFRFAGCPPYKGGP